MTWAWLTTHQEHVLQLKFEDTLRLKFEQDEIPLIPEAKVQYDRLVGEIGIRMVCKQVRKYLEATKCRSIDTALIKM